MKLKPILRSILEAASSDIVDFLKDKEKTNKRTKQFLYHGTSVKPSEFTLKDDWSGDSGNTYENDLPEGYLFLTDDIKEAYAYGTYVIPCELKRYDKLTFKVDSTSPSREFDDDYSGYGERGMWSKFANDSMASVLKVQGIGKATYITSVDNVIPRADLAKEFYKK